MSSQQIPTIRLALPTHRTPDCTCWHRGNALHFFYELFYVWIRHPVANAKYLLERGIDFIGRTADIQILNSQLGVRQRRVRSAAPADQKWSRFGPAELVERRGIGGGESRAIANQRLVRIPLQETHSIVERGDCLNLPIGSMRMKGILIGANP